MGEAMKDARRMAHAVILSSQAAEEGMRMARILAAAAVCAQGGAQGCGHCRDCRKVQTGIHPDVITVRRLEDDKGKIKREIGVDQIRQMAADAAVLPNEARRKVYILEEADSMNLSAQNAALKLLEEPPAGAVFLLCTVNPGKLLPTVLSRCELLYLNGQSSEEDRESAKLAREYLLAAASGDRARLFLWCAKNEGMDSTAATAFLNSVTEQAADILCSRTADPGLGRERLLAVSALADRCRSYLRVNVGVKQVFGLLAVDSIAGENGG